jgi:hypothetical protein
MADPSPLPPSSAGNTPGMSADPLHAAIQDLLLRAPRTWAAIDRDALSATEERALGLLTAAGLIEVRVGLEFSMAGHPQGLRLTLEMTGETGLAQALAPVLTDLMVRWETALAAQRQAGISDPVAMTPYGGWAWRIAVQGERAKQDLASPDADVRAGMFSFVLRRPVPGPGGQRVLVPVDPTERPADLRDLPLIPVDGRATVKDRTWTLVGAVPATPEGPFPVNVQNWTQGAEAIAAAVATLLPSAQPPADDDKRYGDDPARWVGSKKLALLRYLLAHPEPRSRDQIAQEASQAQAGTPSSIKTGLVNLAQAGWLTENADGTCLSVDGIRGSVRKVGEPP